MQQMPLLWMPLGALMGWGSLLLRCHIAMDVMYRPMLHLLSLLLGTPLVLMGGSLLERRPSLGQLHSPWHHGPSLLPWLIGHRSRRALRPCIARPRLSRLLGRSVKAAHSLMLLYTLLVGETVWLGRVLLPTLGVLLGELVPRAERRRA